MNNTCVCCGEIIPEGYMVCYKCRHKSFNKDGYSWTKEQNENILKEDDSYAHMVS